MTDDTDFRAQGKAERPVFFPAEPAADKLFAIVTTLVTEMAVMRERQDTLERLLADSGVTTPAAIDEFRPDQEATAARRAWRDRYLQRVFAALLEQGNGSVQGAPTPIPVPGKPAG